MPSPKTKSRHTESPSTAAAASATSAAASDSFSHQQFTVPSIDHEVGDACDVVLCNCNNVIISGIESADIGSF